MGFGLALDLLNLREPFIAHPGFGPGGVDGPAPAVHLRGEHQAVAQVGVVRNRQQFMARLALAVHPLPQVLGMLGIQRAEGRLRHLLGVFEEDIAVQVAVVRGGGPLVGGEGRELAGLVEPVGNGHVFLPDGARHLRVNQFLDGLVVCHRSAEPQEDSLNVGLAADLKFLRNRQLADR